MILQAAILLIFESMFSPIFWTLDHFDLYLTPELAPEEWLHWMAAGSIC